MAAAFSKSLLYTRKCTLLRYLKLILQTWTPNPWGTIRQTFGIREDVECSTVRPLAYIDSDVFMICFDITNRESFDNLTEVWLPEIQFFQPNTPVLLVGMKCDLRSISSNRWVTVSEPSFQSSSCIFSSQSVMVSASPSQLCKTYCEDIFSCVYFLWMRFLLKKKLSEH